MKFSVIIPVYNVAPYLKACLDSVVAAAEKVNTIVDLDLDSRPSVEILCVDDGSTDGSGEILDAYAEEVEKRGGGGQRILRLRVLHQPNAGVAAARNRGLDAATGDWLLFVDSDDVVRDTLFADLVTLLKRYPAADFIGFDLQPMDAGDSHPLWRQDNADCRTAVTLSVNGTVEDHFAAFGIYRGAYRRDRFGDIRFPAYARGEDLVYVARVVARADSHVYLRRTEYGYRNRPASAVHAEMSSAIVREAVRFHREMFCTLAASGKALGPRLWPMRLEQWILRIPIILSGQKRDAEWAAAWSEWRQSMSVASGLPYVSGILRLVARLGGRCPCPVLIALSCRIGLRLLKVRH